MNLAFIETMSLETHKMSSETTLIWHSRSLVPDSPCITCVQYRRGYHDAYGGYLEYRGGVQYRGEYYKYRGGYLEYHGGYHDVHGGYHEYCGGVFSTVGGYHPL